MQQKSIHKVNNSIHSAQKSSKRSAHSARSRPDTKNILVEFQQQMIELEQALNKELRIKTRKLDKMQRDLNESQDYFRELVFLIEEILNGKNPLESTQRKNNQKPWDRSLD